jgi:hypothetical protein
VFFFFGNTQGLAQRLSCQYPLEHPIVRPTLLFLVILVFAVLFNANYTVLFFFGLSVSSCVLVREFARSPSLVYFHDELGEGIQWDGRLFRPSIVASTALLNQKQYTNACVLDCLSQIVEKIPKLKVLYPTSETLLHALTIAYPSNDFQSFCLLVKHLLGLEEAILPVSTCKHLQLLTCDDLNDLNEIWNYFQSPVLNNTLTIDCLNKSIANEIVQACYNIPNFNSPLSSNIVLIFERMTGERIGMVEGKVMKYSTSLSFLQLSYSSPCIPPPCNFLVTFMNNHATLFSIDGEEITLNENELLLQRNVPHPFLVNPIYAGEGINNVSRCTMCKEIIPMMGLSKSPVCLTCGTREKIKNLAMETDHSGKLLDSLMVSSQNVPSMNLADGNPSLKDAMISFKCPDCPFGTSMKVSVVDMFRSTFPEVSKFQFKCTNCLSVSGSQIPSSLQIPSTNFFAGGKHHRTLRTDRSQDTKFQRENDTFCDSYSPSPHGDSRDQDDLHESNSNDITLYGTMDGTYKGASKLPSVVASFMLTKKEFYRYRGSYMHHQDVLSKGDDENLALRTAEYVITPDIHRNVVAYIKDFMRPSSEEVKKAIDNLVKDTKTGVYVALGTRREICDAIGIKPDQLAPLLQLKKDGQIIRDALTDRDVILTRLEPGQDEMCRRNNIDLFFFPNLLRALRCYVDGGLLTDLLRGLLLFFNGRGVSVDSVYWPKICFLFRRMGYPVSICFIRILIAALGFTVSCFKSAKCTRITLGMRGELGRFNSQALIGDNDDVEEEDDDVMMDEDVDDGFILEDFIALDDEEVSENDGDGAVGTLGGEFGNVGITEDRASKSEGDDSSKETTQVELDNDDDECFPKLLSSLPYGSQMYIPFIKSFLDLKILEETFFSAKKDKVSSHTAYKMRNFSMMVYIIKEVIEEYKEDDTVKTYLSNVPDQTAVTTFDIQQIFRNLLRDDQKHPLFLNLMHKLVQNKELKKALEDFATLCKDNEKKSAMYMVYAPLEFLHEMNLTRMSDVLVSPGEKCDHLESLEFVGARTFDEEDAENVMNAMKTSKHEVIMLRVDNPWRFIVEYFAGGVTDHMQRCVKQWYNDRWNDVLVVGSWSQMWIMIRGKMVRCCTVRMIVPMLGFSTSLFMNDPGCKVRIGMLLNLTTRSNHAFYIMTMKLSEDGSPVALSGIEPVQYSDPDIYGRVHCWFLARHGKEVYKNYPNGMDESLVDLSNEEHVEGLYPLYFAGIVGRGRGNSPNSLKGREIYIGIATTPGKDVAEMTSAVGRMIMDYVAKLLPRYEADHAPIVRYIMTVTVSEDGSPGTLSRIEPILESDNAGNNAVINAGIFTRAHRWFRARECKQIYNNYPDGIDKSSEDLYKVVPVEGLYPLYYAGVVDNSGGHPPNSLKGREIYVGITTIHGKDVAEMTSAVRERIKHYIPYLVGRYAVDNINASPELVYYQITVKVGEDGIPSASSSIEQIRDRDQPCIHSRLFRYLRGRHGTTRKFNNYPDGTEKSWVDLSEVVPVEGMYPLYFAGIEGHGGGRLPKSLKGREIYVGIAATPGKNVTGMKPADVEGMIKRYVAKLVGRFEAKHPNALAASSSLSLSTNVPSSNQTANNELLSFNINSSPLLSKNNLGLVSSLVSDWLFVRYRESLHSVMRFLKMSRNSPYCACQINMSTWPLLAIMDHVFYKHTNLALFCNSVACSDVLPFKSSDELIQHWNEAKCSPGMKDGDVVYHWRNSTEHEKVKYEVPVYSSGWKIRCLIESCNFVFDDMQIRNDHFLSTHKNCFAYCDFPGCEEYFSTTVELEEHRSTHPPGQHWKKQSIHHCWCPPKKAIANHLLDIAVGYISIVPGSSASNNEKLYMVSLYKKKMFTGTPQACMDYAMRVFFNYYPHCDEPQCDKECKTSEALRKHLLVHHSRNISWGPDEFHARWGKRGE